MLVAERNLFYLEENGTVVNVPVRLFSPEEDNNRGWGCRITIGWPDGLYTRTIYGVDEFQAIHLALQYIGSRL